MRILRAQYDSDHVASLMNSGHAVAPFQTFDGQPFGGDATVLFQGFELITDQADRTLFAYRNNKDKHGRLIEGFFQKPEDEMLQINLSSASSIDPRTRARLSDDLGLEQFFAALDRLVVNVPLHARALARAIDSHLRIRRRRGHVDNVSTPIVRLVREARIIISLTRYRTKENMEQLKARPNTAAFGYYLAGLNTGMKVYSRDMELIDVEEAEGDPEKALVIAGDELSLVTSGLIDAALNPVFPHIGTMRVTARVFVYLRQSLMQELRTERRQQTFALVQ